MRPLDATRTLGATFLQYCLVALRLLQEIGQEINDEFVANRAMYSSITAGLWPMAHTAKANLH